MSTDPIWLYSKGVSSRNMFVNAHLYPAEVVGCRKQPLHFMAEPWTTVRNLHAALSSAPLQTKLCHRSTIAWRSLQVKHQQKCSQTENQPLNTSQLDHNMVVCFLIKIINDCMYYYLIQELLTSQLTTTQLGDLHVVEGALHCSGAPGPVVTSYRSERGPN